MSTVQKKVSRLPILQGILPIVSSHIPIDMVAGITLAALGIPEVMGYTKIAGTPVITGLYTLVLPIAVFAILGSSRHLVVGADSATAAILAAGLVGLATPNTTQYVELASVLAIMTAAFLIFARIVKLGFLANFLSRSVAVTVVVVGVEQGIILAIVLSIVIHISHSYRPSDAMLVPMPRGHWQSKAVDQNKEAEPGLVVYFFGASLYFANAVRFSEEIVRLVDDAQPHVKWLDVDAAAMIGIDYTGADTIRQTHTILEKRV